MNDLWAVDIGLKAIKTPASILKEQASLLGSKTQNLVIGEVLTSSGASESGIVHRFNIKAPALGNYTYNIFTIYHDVDLYPVSIDVDSSILNTLHGTDKIEYPLKVDSEEDFINTISNILKSPRTAQIINSLLAQSLESGTGKVVKKSPFKRN